MAKSEKVWPREADSKTYAQVTQFMTDTGDGKTIGKISKDALKNGLDIDTIELDPVQGGATEATATVIAPGPAGQRRKMDASPGWYSVGGVPVEATSGHVWKWFWNGTTWSLVDMGELPDSSAKAKDWAAGTYMSEETAVKDGVLYRVKKSVVSTTAEPGVSAGWEVLGKVVDVVSEFGESTEKAAAQKLVTSLDTRTKFFENKISLVSNNEFLYALVTHDNVLLWGKRRDGSTYDCDESIFNEIISLNDEIESLDTRTKFFEDKISLVSNNEFLWLIVDSENKVIEGIRRDGIKFIQNVKTKNFETELLKLSTEGMTEFQKDLKGSGFSSGTGDWSDEKYIQLPIPRGLAKVNIESNSLPTTKTANIDAVLEYYDMDGNYFKSKIILNAQGSSSMSYIKKNLSIDLLMDDNEEREVKFGDWVARDSFHIKAYYIDGFVGQCIVGYKYAMQYYNSRPENENRPYKKYYTPVSIWNGSGDILQDLGTEAKCMPDGFPVELYHNGVYYGLYVIALSKHRSNYNLNKDSTNHVFLDGELGAAELFGGAINWTKFEVRNPNKLKDTSGADYDSDNPKELSNTDPRSAATKAHIVRLSNAIATINAQSTDALKRSKYEEYFDVQEVIDYVLQANVIMNYDGFLKNWLWTTYDSLIWQPNFYDQDSIFSLHWKGNLVDRQYDPNVTILGRSTAIPSGHVFTLYTEQLEARYKELRDLGIISVDNIIDLLTKWVKKIGKDAYDRNKDMWPETPSYRASNIDDDNWELIAGFGSSSTYNNDTAYTTGQEVFYGVTTFLKFKAKKNTQGNPPITQFYSLYPQEAGVYQSIDRVRLWLIDRLAKLDEYFNYNI